MKTLARLLPLVLTVLGGAALAEDAPAAAAPAASDAPPTADEIRRVFDYLENGKDRGPALMEIVACNKVDQTKGSPTQHNCVEPITGPVKKGSTVLAWTLWFCPRGGKYEDITLKYLFENDVRTTIDLTIDGEGRRRTYRGYTVTKPGKWTIKAFRGSHEFGSASFTVEP